MSKNILILAGSPRKGGNSDLLCAEFARGAAEAGHTVQTIRVHELGLAYCLGCEHCQNHGGECVHKDGMAEVLNKMIAADAIVLATPVYFYTMAAQLKALIDRTVARYTEIAGKEFYFIVAAADGNIPNMRRTIESLRGFTSCLSGAREKGIVYGVGAWKKGDIAGQSSMRQAYELGAST